VARGLLPRGNRLLGGDRRETGRGTLWAGGPLADEAGALKAKTEAIKDEAIRRGLKKAEGEFWKLALSPPGESNRTDKSRLLAVPGVSEIEYIARYTSPIHTDWVMKCTARKIPRAAEEPVVLPPPKAKRAV
jgi:hypothetical protein